MTPGKTLRMTKKITKGLSRRQFLEESLLAAAAAAAASAAAGCATRGPMGGGTSVAPSDRLRVAIVGVNGRGMSHVRAFAKRDDTEIVAICDVDEDVFGRAERAVRGSQPQAPRFVQDLRRVLDDPSIDAVSMATPNHWHALGAAWAVEAGKDVYLEKPVSHNGHEGRALVTLARQHGRIVQTGSQSRSNPGMRQFIDYIRSGRLGTVKLARGLCYKRRKSIGQVGTPQRPPKHVNYDLWLGPAPLRPDVPRERLHYDWHWQWDYGDGDIGNQGVHEMDKARWGLGKQSLPETAICLGGRFGYTDDGQTPNTQVCFYDYGDAQLIFEVRGLETDRVAGVKVGNIFYGTQGFAVSSSYSSGSIFDFEGNEVETFSGGGDHFDNFVKAVRSRQHTDLNADVEDGHLSAALCHLGNVSYRLGTPQPRGSLPSALAPTANAEEAFVRFERHLIDNGVPVAKNTFVLGPQLRVDAAAERLIDGGPEAAALWQPVYRQGFAFSVPAGQGGDHHQPSDASHHVGQDETQGG